MNQKEFLEMGKKFISFPKIRGDFWAIKKEQNQTQLSFINPDDPLLEELKAEIIDLDINPLTVV